MRTMKNENYEKKPFYKKWWFILIVVFIFIGAIGNSNNDVNSNEENQENKTDVTMKIKGELHEKEDPTLETKKEPTKIDKPKEEKPNPIVVTVDELYSALDDNALKANKDYKGKLVQLTGYLDTIDSSGAYFTLEGDETVFLESVHVSMPKKTREKLTDSLMNYKAGDKITITGKITEVGEIMGYFVDAEHIF